jgi:hypothetical protein
MQFCIKEQNPCESSPCLHQGVCVAKSNYNFQCICRPYYTGKVCEYPGRYSYISIYISVSKNVLVPYQLPTSNHQCTRICRNGGVCLVK